MDLELDNQLEDSHVVRQAARLEQVDILSGLVDHKVVALVELHSLAVSEDMAVDRLVHHKEPADLVEEDNVLAQEPSKAQ